MSLWRRTLAWLRLRERPISAGVALLGFSVGALSMLVALFQAALLYSQRATPYRTAIYARQLEVTEDFVGAVYQQHIRIINLYNDCRHRLDGSVGQRSDYPTLAQEFRAGAQALHAAYGAAATSFPADIHERAHAIVLVHEDLFDNLVAPSGDCRTYVDRYQLANGRRNNSRLYEMTGELVNELRDKMGIEVLSWPAPVREAVRAAPKPEDEQGGADEATPSDQTER